MKRKDSEGNLHLALMPLIAPMAVGRFLGFGFATCDGMKGGMNQVVSLRDVNASAAGRRPSRCGLPGLDLQVSVLASCYPF